MANKDPWIDISRPPTRAVSISARRVSRSSRWNLYWAVDVDRNYLLILQHGKAISRSQNLPNLRGLRVEVQPADNDKDVRIVIRLMDSDHKDIFLRFCHDIVDATVLSHTEEQAVNRFLSRTWQWHRLLQDSRDNRLSDSEQRGLIGELVALEKHVLPAVGPYFAVKSWTGPLGTPHDFEISRTHLEVKVRNTASPYVTISSERQLDLDSADRLFLYVSEVAVAREGESQAQTLAELAKRVRGILADQDMAALELFEDRLFTVGFNWTDDYDDKFWSIGRESLYEVRDGFPRIAPSMLLQGVGRVRYTVSLSQCKSFRIDPISFPTICGECCNDD